MSAPGERRSQREQARVVGIIQARMTSERLPGKSMIRIQGIPAIALLLERLRGSSELAAIVIATSDDPTDHPIQALAREHDVPCVRGALEDVLSRFRQAANLLGGDALVRITADCPLLDPAVVDLCVRRWRDSEAKFVANCLDPRTFPDGMDVEVLSRDLLTELDWATSDPADREHVTSLVHTGGLIPVGLVERVDMVPDCGKVRVTLDTLEDVEVIEGLVRACGPEADLPSLLEELGVHGVELPVR